MNDNPETFRRIGEIIGRATVDLAQTRAAQIMQAAQEMDPVTDVDPLIWDDADGLNAENRFRQLESEFDRNPELLAIIRRIKRRAEVMRLDANRGTTARQDAEEIRILADMAEKLLGGEHG